MSRNQKRAPVSRRRILKISGSVLGGIAASGTVVAAESDTRFIVDLKDTASTRALEEAGLDVIHDLDAVDLAVVRGREKDVENVTRKFAPDTETKLDLPVEDEVPIQRTEEATDEPLYALQWDKQAQNIPEAHEITGGEGTRVAVIDSGVDPTHPNLRHAVDENLSQNFTDDGGDFTDVQSHGTHVSGIIAANDANDEGVVGSAPETTLIACRVFDADMLASFADVLAAIVYSAEQNCDAANMSLGAYPIPRQGLGPFYGRVLNRVTTFANRRGTVLVAAAGNDSADLQHDKNVISLPNEAAQVMSVSATGPIGFMWGDEGLREPFTSPAFYTNYGTNAIDLAAPGGDADRSAIGTGVDWFLDLVLNTIPTRFADEPGESPYGWKGGTSMAAPQVTGAVALVRSQYPNATADKVESILERAASVPDGFDKAYYGAGFLDPAAAVRNENNNNGNS